MWVTRFDLILPYTTLPFTFNRKVLFSILHSFCFIHLVPWKKYSFNVHPIPEFPILKNKSLFGDPKSSYKWKCKPCCVNVRFWLLTEHARNKVRGCTVTKEKFFMHDNLQNLLTLSDTGGLFGHPLSVTP